MKVEILFGKQKMEKNIVNLKKSPEKNKEYISYCEQKIVTLEKNLKDFEI